MTTITITTSDEKYKCIECKGHAGFAEYGNDIVCSAISVLMINLINSVEALTDDKTEVFQDEKKGILRLSFKEVPTHDAEVLLRSFEIGVESIFREYGKKFLNIKFRRE